VARNRWHLPTELESGFVAAITVFLDAEPFAAFGLRATC
jgi:hypothetical protein